MAALRVFLSLTICLLLGHEKLAPNNAPCQPSQWNNAFNTFVKRHLRAGLPNTLDQNVWERYIRNNNICNRPTQSFLDLQDLHRVTAVCTRAGGKTYMRNLCISNRPFTFFTVRIDTNTCTIMNVIWENKHLILACDRLVNGCLPVHFEGNPGNQRPNNNANSCQ